MTVTAEPFDLPVPGGYEWPPVPILDADKAAEILAERLQAAYDDLEAQRLRLATAAVLGQTQLVSTWLEDFQAGIRDFMAFTMGNVQEFLVLHLGPIYEEGARYAEASQQMTWNMAHQAALTSLAIDTYKDFLQRSQEAERVSEAFARAVRQASSEEIPKIAAGGRTAKQVAAQLEAKLSRQYGVDTVVYRDGSRVPVRAYAQMAARTKSAVAYNSGSLNQWHQDGVGFVEVFDGALCGWSSHDDPDLANATIRSVADAAGALLSHPNCRRGFGARPDVTSAAEAAVAELSTTPEQRADQAESERRAGNRRRPKKEDAPVEERPQVPEVAPLAGTEDHQRLADDYGNWMDSSASEVQKDAFARYTQTSAYQRWNPHLRGQETDLRPQDAEHIDAMTELIRQSPPLKAPVDAFRGVRDPGAVFGESHMPAGAVFTDRAFLSTTMDGAIMDHYSGGSSGEPGAVINVRIPAGIRAAVPATEGQVIVAPGSRYRVLSDRMVEEIADQKGYEMLMADNLAPDALQEQLERYKIIKRYRAVDLEVLS